MAGILVTGMLVPYNDPDLMSSTGTAAASPYVIAMTRAGITVLPHIINACILIFVLSAANSDLYIGSRTLYGLAAEGKAPLRIFARVNRLGVSWPTLIFCTYFCAPVFLNVSSSSAKGASLLPAWVVRKAEWAAQCSGGS